MTSGLGEDRRGQALLDGDRAAPVFDAVGAANIVNSKHMGEEERQDLLDFRQQASLQLRHDIAVEFLRYEALKAAEGITPRDKDPQEYVEEHSGGTPKDSDRAGNAPDESLQASETE